MAMVMPDEQKQRDVKEYQFPTGVYLVRLAAVQEIGPSAKFPDGNNRLVFEFVVEEGQYKGKKTCLFVGKSLFKDARTKKESKLVTFARSMGVVDPEKGFDPDTLIGRVFTGTCESQPGPDGDRTWVRFLTPASQASSTAASPPPAAAGGPPPRATPAVPPPRAERRFWIDMGAGAENRMVTLSEIQARFGGPDQIDWEKVELCPDGSQQWGLFFNVLPEANQWAKNDQIPF